MSDLKGEILARLRDEIGTIDKDAPEAVALLYPSPYRVGMSSLGYQTIYRSINATEGRAAHRAFLPDDLDAWRQSRAPLVTHEKLRPVSDYPVIAVSVAYETELAGLIQCLELAGIPPLAEDRSEQHPFILAGGPLTFSNPLPLAPFVDAVVMGEADQSVHDVLGVIFGSDSRDSAMRSLSVHPHVFVPSAHGDMLPPIDKADSDTLPAYSQIITPHTELRNMFLIEPERGCHRGCTYCVMRRSTNDGMRIVKMDRILSLIPDEAKRVGLVGAATTDHPQIADIVNALADSGREVGLSSLRADRLTDELVAALRRGGHRVLTTASDGASQRMRDIIQRKTSEAQLRQAAELARRHGMKRLKLYVMVGLPEETDEDIDELIEFGAELSSLIPLSLGVAPFVAKRNTPLDGTPFAGMPLVDARLRRLRRGVRGRV
ncbi:MAG: radical SAM protein, partial [Polyangiales bacterium]